MHNLKDYLCPLKYFLISAYYIKLSSTQAHDLILLYASYIY
jgi:hypothetical protein